MGYYEKDMSNYIKINLRKDFHASDGWEIFPEDNWESYRPDFIVERKYRGRIERVVIEAKMEPKITQKHIDQINSYARNLAGGNAVIKEKILAVVSRARARIS